MFLRELEIREVAESQQCRQGQFPDYQEEDTVPEEVLEDAVEDAVLDTCKEEFLRELEIREVAESQQWRQGQFPDYQEEEIGRKRSLFACPFNRTLDCVQSEATQTRIASLRQDIQKLQECDCEVVPEFDAKPQHPMRTPFTGYVADGQLLEYRETRRRNRRGRRGQRRRRVKSEKKRFCSIPSMNCFIHDSAHWKTLPLWPDSLGRFCFCQNSNNNSYWCLGLRTKNETANFLFCEYITGFVSFYDINEDPHQLRNTIFSLPLGVLEQLGAQLAALKTCTGRAECERAIAGVGEKKAETKPKTA